MIRAHVLWWLVMLGYKIRPYDMIADRRRWFWQRRALCQFLGGWPE
jgi:hypothetical protein